MDNNGNYYQQLLKYSLEVKCPSIIQIDLDLRRTFPDEEKVMNEKFQKSLRNILMCYSTRNSTIGYCQGMNFVVSRLLLILGNEEYTQKEVAKKLGISQSYISRIEKKVIKKLKNLINT